MLRRALAVSVAMVFVPAGGAQAATTFGPDLPSENTSGGLDCSAYMVLPGGGTTPADSGCTAMTDGAGSEARAPSSGVVVKWRFKISDTGSVRLRLLRFTGSGTYKSAAPLTFAGTTTAAPGVAQEVVETPARLPIQQGDFLGLEHVGSLLAYSRDHATNTGSRFFAGGNEGQVGNEYNVSAIVHTAASAPVQVVIEPDADNDGFGDETQDACLGNAGTTDGCPPGTISGHVDNGAGATLTLDGGATTTTADSNGNYAFSGLTHGDHTVHVQPVFMTTCDPNCTKTVTVKGDTQTVNFTLFIAPGGPPAGGGGGGGGGTGTTGQNPPPPDTTAPVLSPLSLSHATFKVNSKGAAVAKAKPNAAKGTTLKFTSSEAGTATFTISSVKKIKKKTRISPVAAFHAAVLSGKNAIPFSGRVKIGSATKTLGAGSYQVTLVDKDAAGNKSNTVKATFKIVH